MLSSFNVVSSLTVMAASLGLIAMLGQTATGLPQTKKVLPVIDATNVYRPAQIRGSAIVLNTCPFSIFMTACYQPTSWAPVGACDPQQTIPAGEAYGETYWNELNNGRSLAIYRASVDTGAIDNPMQLEYTVQVDDETVFYDVSNFDGNPFADYGFNIWSTDPSGFKAHCPPPARDCPSVFPISDPIGGDVHALNITRSIGVTLCVQ